MKTESQGKGNANWCDGKLVSVAGDKLTSTCAKGDEHHYTIAPDAKVTCDGNASKSSDLKAGSTIRMTLSKDDKNKVTAIDCGKHISDLDLLPRKIVVDDLHHTSSYFNGGGIMLTHAKVRKNSRPHGSLAKVTEVVLGIDD